MSRTILIIDDCADIARISARYLESAGYRTIVATSATEACKILGRTTPDLIVLDIMLPGMNGYKVCRTLRDEEVWTPILMLTAKDGEYDEAEALDTGADDFLSKPFSFVVLVARLRALARRRSDANLQPLELGDLVLEPVSRTVRRGDTDIPLSPREFALLEALMRHTGEVVAKTDLLERVWGEDFEGDPNVVEVYIGYLRRKIDRPFGHSDLETVRGEGYRMGAATHSAS